MGSGLIARRSTAEANFFPRPSTNRKSRPYVYCIRGSSYNQSIAAKNAKTGQVIEGLKFTWRRLHRLWVGRSLFFHQQRGLNTCYIRSDAVGRQEHNSQEMKRKENVEEKTGATLADVRTFCRWLKILVAVVLHCNTAAIEEHSDIISELIDK